MINKINFFSIIYLFSAISAFAQFVGPTQKPREIGDRPVTIKQIIIEEKLILDQNSQGILATDGVITSKVFEARTDELSLEKPIAFFGPNSSQNASETRDNLGLGSAATKAETYFIKRSGGDSFNGNIIGTNNSQIILRPLNPIDNYHFVYMAGNAEPQGAVGQMNIPIVGIGKGIYSFSALTVDLNNDAYPASNEGIFNSLARVVEANGTTARIWDSANDGQGSGLSADTIHGFPGLKLVSPPNTISDAATVGDIAYKEHNGLKYMALYTSSGWVWWEVSAANFPWQ